MIVALSISRRIWLLDVANQVPRTSQLDGVDISFNQCPPREWLPKNVTLRLADVFREPAEELIEKYDVIHIRHFICVVKGDDPSKLLQNLLRMLKPGGWIQWDEWNVFERHFTKSNPNTPQENIDKLGKEFEVMRRHTSNPSWAQRLDEFFLLEDMQHVAMEKRLSSKSHLPYMNDLTLLVFQELIDGAETAGNIDAERARYLRQLLGGATRESRMGNAWNLTRCMAVGQKSLD